MERNQPLWNLSDSSNVKLKLYNSLTKKKEVFIPQDGNTVRWYSCGPTVYDAAHMGHARSYISFDILRRVMSDYFGFDVMYVMNITDIDDKIIKRARQNFLFEQYRESNNTVDDVIAEIQKAIQHYKTLWETAEEKETKEVYKEIMDGTTEAILQAKDCKRANCTDLKVRDTLLAKTKDVLCEWFDFMKKSEVCNTPLFSKLPAHYEKEFFNDMDSLNVLPPDVLTRVSEYMEEIIAFIQKIIEKGLAYASHASVYFDTIQFHESPDHVYGKLVPQVLGQQDGESDSRTASHRFDEKKHPSDFALWKTSKPGEPSWDSPWGKGRPGWHIECSVMASHVLGESLDIHTGGYDLKFPHHDNELAQAEAYFGHDHWVRYFLHSGHLTISGCKMSKSLKNFITIKEALECHSARHIRLVFLLHSWKEPLEYSLGVLESAMQYEKTITEFQHNVKDLLRSSAVTSNKSFTKMTPDATELNNALLKKKAGIYEALCDNIDTRTVLNHLQDLIRCSNRYMLKNQGKQVDRSLLKNILSYVLKMLKMLGANFEEEKSESNVANVEKKIMPILKVFADFREKVRFEAKEMKIFKILKHCDTVRDEELPPHGVRFEDRKGQKTAIKYVDPEVLAKEKQQQEKRMGK